MLTLGLRLARRRASASRPVSHVRQRVGPHLTREYDLSGSHIHETTQSASRWSCVRSGRALLQVLLPRGFPGSVDRGYVGYARWQAVAAVSGTACGVLSMQSLLLAIGIGSASSLPIAATMNWVLKDGLGQLGGVVFASAVSSRFDANPKLWRMVSAVAMETASLIELLLPLAPQYFLLGASIANIGKNISFLAASASRAAIHKSMALHGNLADVTAKAGSQSIVCSLLGTALGLSAAASTHDAYALTVCVFLSLSSLSIGATYASLKHVTLRTLTPARLDLLLHDWFNDSASKGSGAPTALTPMQVARMERGVLTARVTGLPPLLVNSDVSAAFPSAAALKVRKDHTKAHTSAS